MTLIPVLMGLLLVVVLMHSANTIHQMEKESHERKMELYNLRKELHYANQWRSMYYKLKEELKDVE